MTGADFQKRKQAFIQLGKEIQNPSERMDFVIHQAQFDNHWFDEANSKLAIQSWAKSLTEENITKWLAPYEKDLQKSFTPKKIGLILAGNIPLVGFHDIICVLMSGHHALIKQSSQDSRLILFLMELLVEIEPALSNHFTFIERLKDFDAVIATGSNNSARYFDHYFGKYPHIIRKNRSSVAILNGKETADDFQELGKDIFTYYGLGCRNISKMYVPESYDFKGFYEGIESYHPILDNFKYSNNYDYNRTLLLMNSVQHLDNRFLMISENKSLNSPMASLYYEIYKNENDLHNKLNLLSDKIQCIVSKDAWYENSINFGQSQSPELWDYADGVDTMKFLVSLS
jgi:hypothetical protein